MIESHSLDPVALDPAASKSVLAKGSDSDTPLMKQYWQIKSQHLDKILLFRMGDFYEIFHDDAVIAAPVLNVTLTSRNKKAEDPTPMCGVPHHSVAGPINRLLEAGYKVAICDQLEDPKLAKGIVKRGVTRILTPGLVLDPEGLVGNEGHWICSFEDGVMSFLEPTTGEAFFSKLQDAQDRRRLFEKWAPKEIVVEEAKLSEARDLAASSNATSKRAFVSAHAFSGNMLSDGASSEPRSARLLVDYAVTLQGADLLPLLRPFEERKPSFGLEVSEVTLGHLEILKTYRGETAGSLLASIDRTKTSAGARLLREWLQSPLAIHEQILERQNRIGLWMKDASKLQAARTAVARIGDIERRLARLASSSSGPRDLVSLIAAVEKGLEFERDSADEASREAARFCTEIRRAFIEDAPVAVKSGYFVREGYRSDLDELIALTTKGEELLLALETREREKSGISTLKIRYNQVFGYFFEITNSHLAKAPAHFVRKQTLANAERFSSTELQELEEKLLSAQHRREEQEVEVFKHFRRESLALARHLQVLAQRWARLDVDMALAWIAIEKNYVRPTVSLQGHLKLSQSRHPVVEQFLDRDSRFVANSLELSAGGCLLITGPNMAGKSTLMRQVALITWMAHIGSYVPATEAVVPLVDGIFTRIGASDFLTQGLSTFMVEMTETAEIMKRATSRSLLILDEIGRGTGTEDGVCLAQAVLEHLVDNLGAMTFFATHYHELTELAAAHTEIQNAHMAIQEDRGEIRFLHALVMGASSRSYGIEVGRLAGLPTKLVRRASELMASREKNSAKAKQMDMFAQPATEVDGAMASKDSETSSAAWKEDLESLDLNNLTPIAALTKLSELRQKWTCT